MPPLDVLPDDAQAAESWEAKLLREHAELAMTLCRRIVKQAEDANWLSAGGDQTFARVSHALQMTLALKQKLEVEAAAERRRAAKEAAEVAKERAAERKAVTGRRSSQLRQAAESVINHLPKRVTDTISHRQLTHRLDLRMQSLDVTRDIVDRPFNEVLAQICREIGIPETALPGANAAAEPETAEDRAERRARQLAQADTLRALIADHAARPRTGRDPPDG